MFRPLTSFQFPRLATFLNHSASASAVTGAAVTAARLNLFFFSLSLSPPFRMMTRAFGRKRLNVTAKAPLLFWGVSSEITTRSVSRQRSHEETWRLWWFFLLLSLSLLSFSHPDHSVTTGGAQPCHDVKTPRDQTFITSTQSTSPMATSVSFPGKRRGHSGVRVMQLDWHLSRWFAYKCSLFVSQSIQTVAPGRDAFKKKECNPTMPMKWQEAGKSDAGAI